MKYLIKKSFCVFGIGACVLSEAVGPSLGWDPFNYTVGSDLEGASGGEIVGTWPSAWSATTATSTTLDYTIVLDSITPPSGYGPATEGNKSQISSMVSHGARLQRQIPTQALNYLHPLTSGESMWISFLTLAKTPADHSQVVMNTTPYIVNGPFLLTSPIPDPLGIAIRFMSAPTGQLNVFQIQRQATANTYVATYYQSTAPGTLPTVTGVSTSPFTLNTDPTDVVIFGYDIPNFIEEDALVFSFDELRLGVSYAEVTTPEPATLAGLGIAAVGYWGKRRRKAGRNRKADQ